MHFVLDKFKRLLYNRIQKEKQSNDCGVKFMKIDRISFIVALTKSGLTGTQLAERSGVTRGTISAIKCGKSCSEETASKLAAGLGVPMSELVGGEKTC